MEHAPQSPAAAARTAIEAAGGGAELARALGIRKTSVQDWKSAGIPASRVPAVARVTGLPLHLIRPDLFDAPAVVSAPVGAITASSPVTPAGAHQDKHNAATSEAAPRAAPAQPADAAA